MRRPDLVGVQGQNLSHASPVGEILRQEYRLHRPEKLTRKDVSVGLCLRKTQFGRAGTRHQWWQAFPSKDSEVTLSSGLGLQDDYQYR